jgi:hypothetical protein
MFQTIRNRVFSYKRMFSQTPIPKITPVNPDSHKQPTQNDKINANIGLKTYMTNIYKKSGVAFGGSLITSMIAPSLVETLGIVDIAPVLWVANIPLSFYLIWKMSMVEPEVKKTDGHLYEVESSQ